MKRSEVVPAVKPSSQRLGELTAELQELEARLRLGGGPEKIERQHSQENSLRASVSIYSSIRIHIPKRSDCSLLTTSTITGAPAAGVVTVVGQVEHREVVVVANDATVKAGSWWPETIKKILRAQEIAMRSHVPIIYLVDSAGVNLPYQGGVFPASMALRESFITTRLCGAI
jgi:acetyl-CoA carboxylase carboxyltransferase component